MLLARPGHDVVVMDQASFPSDTASTRSIARGGVVQLRGWGLLDQALVGGARSARPEVGSRRGRPGSLGDQRLLPRAEDGIAIDSVAGLGDRSVGALVVLGN
jgi:hypothetical protein